jgi:hypothetical protein
MSTKAASIGIVAGPGKGAGKRSTAGTAGGKCAFGPLSGGGNWPSLQRTSPVLRHPTDSELQRAAKYWIKGWSKLDATHLEEVKAPPARGVPVAFYPPPMPASRSSAPCRM